MFNNYPYGDLHEINLDWFLQQFQALKTLVNNMESILTALQSLPDASGASDGQVLTADGNGGWQWEDPQSGGGADIPDSVKQAINTVIQNVAFKNNNTYTAELAVIQAWAGQTPADSVTLSANSGSAVIGGTITITASTTGTGTLQAVSSDTGVATVAVNGSTITITAIAAGSATITVTYGTASATYSATVTSQPILTYTITNTLSNVTNSNAATQVDQNDSYTATLTADQGYTLDSVTVTMGGSDVTSTVYNAGAINIASVTGNVVITATATAQQTYDWTDYEQTGLIAQFDGIQNTSSGHDSSATTWKDLIGSYDLVSDGDAPAGTWTNDGLVFSEHGLNGWFASGAPTSETNLTVELVYIPNGANNGQLVQIADTSSTGTSNMKISFYSDNSIGVQGTKSYTYPVTDISATRVVQVIYASGGSVTVYADGEQLSVGSTQHSMTSSFNYMAVNGFTNNAYTALGKFCAFRVYNTVLTKAQLDTNRAIDNARFSL